MNPNGRPAAYKPDFCEQARKCCLPGAMTLPARRPLFSSTSFRGGHTCCGRAGAVSQALVGPRPYPPASVLGYSPASAAGAPT